MPGCCVQARVIGLISMIEQVYYIEKSHMIKQKIAFENI
jgi:hypothetical protein